MTLYVNNPGTLALADNTTATSANSAAPNALSPTTSGTGTVRFRTAGGGKWEFVGPASSVARFDLAVNAAAVESEYMFDLTGLTAPSADCRILQHFESAQTNSGMGVGVLATSGFLRVYDSKGAIKATSSTSVTGKRFRLFLGTEKGTGTADGEIHVAAYIDTAADDPTSTTPTWVYDASNVDTGIVNITTVRLGKVTSAPVFTINVKYGQVDDTKYTPRLGPITSVAAPVLTYTRQTVIEIDGAATNSGVITLTTDGSSPATPTSITGPDGSGVFRVIPPGTWTTNMVLNLVATNSGGTDTEVITITPAVGGGASTIDADALTYVAATGTWE